MKRIQSYSINEWKLSLKGDDAIDCIDKLESGSVLFFPNLQFMIQPEEKNLFSPNLVKKGRKNISYFLKNDTVKGLNANGTESKTLLGMMRRFAYDSVEFIKLLLPHYCENIEIGRTSFRPVEIKGRRNNSHKKNDTLLHLDSFPSSPTNGKRILRFFANANPYNLPRVWKLGEPYKQVIKRFLPLAKKPFFGSRTLMHRLGITKSFRILYDHYMLQIHDKMKEDALYQEKVDQEIFEFPPSTCWLAFTDQVSHAVVSGQYVFEQSFYLPSDAQLHPEKSPLHYMEKLFQKKLRT